MNMIPIKPVDQRIPSIIRDIGKLRASVWFEEGHLSPCVCPNGVWLDELDELDSRGNHWAAFDGNRIVAAARLTLHHSLEDMPQSDEFSPYDLEIGLPYAFMSRLVVEKAYRGRGLARRLDGLRLREAALKGAKAVLVLATPCRVKTLQKQGVVHFGLSGIHVDDMPDLKIETHVMAHSFNGSHLNRLAG